MKKFKKLAAVFAALLLALSCFVACSNGADDDDPVRALQGLWINYEVREGFYFVGSTMYGAGYKDGKYYYFEDGISFSVSGDKIIAEIDGWTGELFSFTIDGNAMTMSAGGSTGILKKVDVTPTEWKED